jgi:hypothetical protein
MSDYPPKPVVGRSPIEGSDEELDMRVNEVDPTRPITATQPNGATSTTA